jgi:hypothetical protein
LRDYNENLSFFSEDLLDECPSVGYTAPALRKGTFLFPLNFIEKLFMPGLLLQLVTRKDTLPVGRLSGVRNVVTVIGIIVVGVVITPLAGWVA